ncbi:MAG TPA: hypothetical protein VEC14_09230 [Reyranellaceae bacterium]|nr:hypothetical protein [Reyranellaceae bacterium]
MRSMLAALLLIGGTQLAAAQSIGGHYTVQGATSSGGMYAGVAQISFSGETCRITWHTGSAPVTGVCVVQGRAFSAGYQLHGSGVALYELQPDGSLRGVWAGTRGGGTETLYPR